VGVTVSRPAGAIRRRLRATVISVFGLFVVAACGGHAATYQTPGRHSDAANNGSLNSLTVHDILASIGKAGLAVPNPRDVTQNDCPEIGCTDMVETDTVSIIKFLTPGRAQFIMFSRSRTW
jgi:hypothetical protein